MSTPNLDNYPELLEDLWAKVAELIPEYAIPQEKADAAAFRVTEYIRHEWSGRNRYFVKPKKAVEPDPLQVSFLEEPAATMPPPENAEDIRLLRERSIEIFVELGFPGQASDCGVAIADLVKREWAGERIYIPKGRKYDLQLRDYNIWREWDGSYAGKMRLIAQHGITEQRFYQIIKVVQRRHWKREQSAFPFYEAV